MLAGGTANDESTSFALKAVRGDARYNIGENLYLAKNVSMLSYEPTITVARDIWSFDETTTLLMKEFVAPMAHGDHNTLHRVG